MGVHQALKEALMGPDRPAVVDMLQAARLTHQQMDRGLDFSSALHSACMDVYVRAQRNNAVRTVSIHSITFVCGKLKVVQVSFSVLI